MKNVLLFSLFLSLFLGSVPDGASAQSAEEDVIAVEYRARLVHQQRPVGVPVEGEATIRTALEDRVRETLGSSRATAGVDILAVGLGRDRRNTSAETIEQRSGEGRSGAVCRVHDDMEAGEGLRGGGSRDQEGEGVIADRAVDGG